VVGTDRTAANGTQPESFARWYQTSLSHGGEFVGYGVRVRTQPSTVMISFGANIGCARAVGLGSSLSLVPTGVNWFCA